MQAIEDGPLDLGRARPQALGQSRPSPRNPPRITSR
jgi:hypothetical protein